LEVVCWWRRKKRRGVCADRMQGEEEQLESMEGGMSMEVGM
jgi:hypothetical protein